VHFKEDLKIPVCKSSLNNHYKAIKMKTTTVKSNKIHLPVEIIRRLEGKEIEKVETREGILLRPVEDVIKSTRGFLKGKGSFSSKKYMAAKNKEKALE
jgi:hypothetical protein